MKKSITPEPISNPAKRFAILTLSTGLGLGYAPVAPGTFGSLLGIPLGLLLLQYPSWMSFIVLSVLVIATAPVVERACKHWGQMDSGRVVWDEVIGQAIALLGLRGPIYSQLQMDSTHPVYPSIPAVVVAFLAFRAFDIFKPYPARSFDRRDSGYGVILDDVVAGLYAALTVWCLIKIRWL
ncbi:MAG: phosphatidylglycerophosphatase A [Bdellovibrionota bacterium]